MGIARQCDDCALASFTVPTGFRSIKNATRVTESRVNLFKCHTRSRRFSVKIQIAHKQPVLATVFVILLAPCLCGSQTSNRIVRTEDRVWIRSDATHEDIAQLSTMLGIKSVAVEGTSLQPARMSELFASIQHLPDLEELSMVAGNVTDNEMRQLRSFKHLRVLRAFDNEISDEGLANIHDLTELEELSLDGNHRITANGFRHLSRLTKLKVLRLYGAPLDDSAIAQIKDFRDLEDLQIGKAHITDQGVAYLSRFQKLGTLDLQGTLVTSDGLRYLEDLDQMRWLSLVGTSIDSAGLSHLRKLARLELLFLPFTSIDDEGLVALNQMRQLKYLDLTATRITDCGLVYLLGFTNLESLKINETIVSDKGLMSLRALPNLRYVEIFGTAITSEGIEQFKKAMPGTEIRTTKNY